MDKIKVLICDDAKYICAFFEMMLNNTDKFVCVGKAQDEKEAVERALQLKPDIVLLDIQMDNEKSGIKLIPKLFDVSPESKIVIMSVHEDDRTVFEAIRAGASDYCTKNQEPAEILHIIERVYEGNNEIRASIVKKITNQFSEVEDRQRSLLFMFNNMLVLSKVELDILKSLCMDKSYDEIADERKIEPSTVRTHVHRILRKMGYSNMSRLVKDLKEMGIFDMFKM